MTASEDKAEARKQRREEWIRRILLRTPYQQTSDMYKRCQTDLQALCDDVLMVLATISARSEAR